MGIPKQSIMQTHGASKGQKKKLSPFPFANILQQKLRQNKSVQKIVYQVYFQISSK
jgi:hypothetical protein